MSTNQDRKGFYPLEYRSGAKWTGQANMYYVPSADSTAIFVGDIVIITKSAVGDTTSDAAFGLPLVAQAAAAISTNIIAGVVVGIEPVLGVDITSQNFNSLYRPASVGRYILVADDPELVFVGQSDDGGGAKNVEVIGANVDLIVASGDTNSGISGMQIDISTATTTATLPLKIVGFTNNPDDKHVSGDLAVKYKVMINDHYLKFGTLGMAIA